MGCAVCPFTLRQRLHFKENFKAPLSQLWLIQHSPINTLVTSLYVCLDLVFDGILVRAAKLGYECWLKLPNLVNNGSFRSGK